MEIKAGRPPVATGGQRLEKNCSSFLPGHSIPRCRPDLSSEQPRLCAGGKVVVWDGTRYALAGILQADTFRKPLKWAHLLQRPPAIAVQQQVLDFLEQRGCRRIVAELPDGRVLESPTRAFRRHGVSISRGFGEQVALPLSHWQQIDPRQQSLFLEVN